MSQNRKTIGDGVDKKKLGAFGVSIGTPLETLKTLKKSLLAETDTTTLDHKINPILATLRKAVLKTYDAETGALDFDAISDAGGNATVSLEHVFQANTAASGMIHSLIGLLVGTEIAMALAESIPTKGTARGQG